MMWIALVFQVVIGLIYANAFEWLAHKYLLHGMGRKPKSFWNFHWKEHHRNARMNDFYDADYHKSIFKWNAQSKEALGLILGGIAHLPWIAIAPAFYLTLVYCGIHYYVVHKKAHLDPEWAKTHVPWHFDHHMGNNQNANWCVTRPWFDWILGTRIVFHKAKPVQSK